MIQIIEFYRYAENGQSVSIQAVRNEYGSLIYRERSEEIFFHVIREL